MGWIIFSTVSPAAPAVWLLFGLTFFQAIAHFLNLDWTRSATIIIYLIPFLWILLMLRSRNWERNKLNAIDIGFSAFNLLVLTSAFMFPGLDEHGSVQKYLIYFPFFVLLPYVLGRLMNLQDIKLFSRIMLLFGFPILAMLLLDILIMDQFQARAVFGLDHGRLLVGEVLGALLLVLFTCVLSASNVTRKDGRLRRLLLLVLIGCVTVSLVWVMARGWLIAGLVSVAVVTFMMSTNSLKLRIGLLTYVLAIAILSLMIMPVTDFFAQILTSPPDFALAFATEGCPILGETSCQALTNNIDSVAIRWVLYREALEMFAQNPIFGVGVARFGDCSCTGPGWYPHSTILQSFAEMGLIGGFLQIGLFILATVTLLQLLISKSHADNVSILAFVLGMFVLFLVSDQIYRNYLMATGTWLMLGIVSSLRSTSYEETDCV